MKNNNKNTNKSKEMEEFYQIYIGLMEKDEWPTKFDIDHILLNWNNYFQDINFYVDYFKLINNLDLQSINTVNSIIMRQWKIFNSFPNIKNFWTKNEKEAVYKLFKDFYLKIEKIDNSLYKYKNYYLPCNRFEASVFYDKYNINNLSNLEYLQDKTIIDVGAFIGDSALIFNEIPHKNIICFEIDKYNQNYFEQTIKLNNLENVRLEKVGLYSQNTQVSFYLNGPMSSSKERKGIDYNDKVDVKVIKLDDYVANNNLNIGLIKVDIEGGEQEFLKGAKQTICKQRPILLISIYHNQSDFFNIKPIIESWNLNYKLSIYKSINESTMDETLLIAEPLL